MRPLLASALVVALTAGASANDKAAAPVPAQTRALMAQRGMDPSAPVLIRVYKKESQLEVWKKTRAGAYALLKTFPICRWSGQLGPKRKQGDRQAPEGFYAVAQRQLNPNSAYYLSFDTGFPNAYDRAHGASGSALMVHGTCSSAGCYAMTDVQVGEIYALVRDALDAGQPAFQFQAFPFRMTAENMAKHRTDPHIDFWRQLKEGSDRFEATGEEPLVRVAAGRYAFKTASPDKEAVAADRVAREKERVAALVAEGGAAIRTTYADGGQNAIFAAMAKRGLSLGMVSRPEALAYAGREVTLIPARPQPKPVIAASPEARPSPITTIAGAAPILEARFVPRS